MKQSYWIKTIIFAATLVLQFNTLCFKSQGAAGDVDLSFDPAGAIGSAYYTQVRSLALQPDGKVIAGGQFDSVNGLNTNYGLARLHANGSLDLGFNSGGAHDVYSVALQPDGKVLIGQMGGLARLNSNGTAESYLATGDFIYPVVLQSDGKVILSGFNHIYQCTEPDEPYQNCWIVGASAFFYRLSNGGLDTNFNHSFGPDFFVQSISVQADGKVLIGSASGPTGILRLNANGSLDNSFNAGSGIAGGSGSGQGVNSIAIQPDGKIVIGGNFATFNGTNRNGIVRLNSNGSLDSSFDPGLGVTGETAGVGGINAVALQQDGKVLIGGYFTSVNGANRNHIARLNANGSLDSTFNPGTGANGVVRSLVLQSNGNVLIGGDFLTVNGVTRPYVARLYGDSMVAPFPTLSITRSNAVVILAWPATATGYSLQESTNAALANSWSSLGQSSVTNAGQISVTVPTTGTRFFRLKSP